MPWLNSYFSLLIVSAGTGFTGVFVYSPAPGTGHLADSIAAVQGTDPYGNVFFKGITTYDSTDTIAANLRDGGIVYIYNVGAGQVIGAETANVSTFAFPVLDRSLNGAWIIRNGSNNTQGVAFLPPSNDATGVTDRARITALFANHLSVQLLGNSLYYSDSSPSLSPPAGVFLAGMGNSTELRNVTNGATGITLGNNGGVVRDLLLSNVGSGATVGIGVFGSPVNCRTSNVDFSGWNTNTTLGTANGPARVSPSLFIEGGPSTGQLGLSVGTGAAYVNGAAFLQDVAAPSAGVSTCAVFSKNPTGSNGGNLKNITEDGVEWDTQRRSQKTAGSTAITTVAGTTLFNSIISPGQYTWHLRGTITWQAAAGIPRFTFTGPAGTSFRGSLHSQVIGAAGATTIGGADQSPALTNQLNSLVMTGAGTQVLVDIYCTCTFTASGTLAVIANTSIAADQFNVDNGFAFDLFTAG